jgi:hypothetical protein
MLDRNSIIGLAIAMLAVLFIFFQRPKKVEDVKEEPTVNTHKAAKFAAIYGTPLIDGIGDDEAWQSAQWHPLDQLWAGTAPQTNDFMGRYKVIWDENFLYVMAEITDDALVDTHPDGLKKYWDDDCLEVFIDDDASGGLHQYSYNAFAYHIALDGNVVDIAPDSSYRYYNDHCVTRRVTQGNFSVWEVAIRVFNGKKYVDDAGNIPRMLQKDKQLGFALAYCDNDHSAEREHFMGSTPVEGPDKNRGWIDASVFDVIDLK